MPAVDHQRKTIRFLRRAAQLSQGEVAERAGFSRSLLAHYENGRLDLSPDDLLQVEAVIDEALAKKPRRLVPLKSLLDKGELKRHEAATSEINREMDRVDRLEEALEQSQAEIQKLKQTLSELCATLAEHIGTIGAEVEEGT